MHLVLLWVSCGLRYGKRGVDEGGLPELINLGALEGRHVPEHPVDGVEQLAHDGHQGLHFEFASRQQVLIESLEMGIVARRRLRPAGHKKPSLFRPAYLLSPRGARRRDGIIRGHFLPEPPGH